MNTHSIRKSTGLTTSRNRDLLPEYSARQLVKAAITNIEQSNLDGANELVGCAHERERKGWENLSQAVRWRLKEAQKELVMDRNGYGAAFFLQGALKCLPDPDARPFGTEYIYPSSRWGSETIYHGD